MTPDKWWDMEDRDPPVSSDGNPYMSGGGMKLNTGKMTMQYEMHRAWDEGFAAGAAARTARVCKQLDSANDMVERAWSLIAGAMSGNPRRPTANTEWMDAAHAWEHDYCMGHGISGLRSRSSVGGGGVVSAVDADAPHQREPGEALDTPGTTAARIVGMLRAEFQRFSEDSMATDEDLARRDGWLDAADLIESRFGGGES